MNDRREGEVALADDPALMRGDAHVVFIGRVRSPWLARADCPKNMRLARETARPAFAIIDPPYRAGMAGLQDASHVVLLTWLDRSARNLIVQKPRQAAEAKGVFALRSPVRPNPIGLHVVRLLGVDQQTGVLTLEAVDVLDETPLLDVKPYLPSVDSVPEGLMATGGRP